MTPGQGSLTRPRGLKNLTLAAMLGMAATLAPQAFAVQAACGYSLKDLDVRVWSQADGLPMNMAYAVTQVPDGRIWVGTENGLARFDGHRFEPVDTSHRTGHGLQFVKTLTTDGSGAVYIGTNATGMLVARDLDVAPVAEARSITSAIEGLLLTDDGTLYAGIDGRGVLIREAGQTRLITDADGLDDTRVRALARGGDGGVWVGLATGTIHQLGVDGTVTRFLTGLPRIETLLEDARGRLWIGTRNGLLIRDGDTWHDLPGESGLDRVFVTDLIEDAHGGIWIATSLGGLHRYCDDTLDSLPADHALSSAHVQSLFEDREGGIWAASFSVGLARLSRGVASALVAGDQLPSFPVLPVLQTSDGTMWLGTFGGGLVAIDNRQTIRQIDVGGSNVALTLAERPSGELWVGTRNGLIRMQGDRPLEVLTKADGLPDDTVPSLLVDGDRLWIGTLAGLAVMQDRRIEALSPESGRMQGYVQALFKDAEGTLWIGTQGDGLYRLQGGRLAHAPFSGELPAPTVLSIDTAPGGGLWIGTDAGLALWDGQRLRTFTPDQGMPSDAVFSLLEDDTGALWLSGNLGVYRIERPQLTALLAGTDGSIRVQRFGRDDGMPTSETNGGVYPPAWRARDGRHWYPTSQGVAIFDPVRLQGEAARRHVLIDTVDADGKRYLPEPELVLPPQPSRVTLRFVSPEFRHPDRIEYEYRLIGYETAFYPSPNNTAIFTGLPPGRFQFEVRARGPNESWSEPTRLPFRIAPSLWQRGEVWLGVALLALAALWFLQRWHQRRRARQLLARQQRQRLESLGMLAGGVAHDFNNLLTVILGEAESLIDQARGQPALETPIEHILRAAEQGTGLTRQLLTFARRGEGMKSWVDLSEAVTALRRFIERLMPEQIRTEFRISPEVGKCLIDPSQLQQVLLNLTHNARDAMPEGGKLAIELAAVDQRRELLAAQLDPERTYARLVVSDTGIGMDERTRRHLFEPFFTTRRQGTGLGLAVVYGIVSELGGSIDVASRPGEGTTFTLYLPVRRDVNDPPPAKSR